MKKILTIDGGGIRGIIPGQVLIALEEKLKVKSGRADARIGEYFDFVAGTSTGGILTCIYLCPAADNPAKARFSAMEAVNIYLQNGGEIFSVPLWKKIKSLGGITDEKYDATALEKALHHYFGQIQLSQLIKPCQISAYNIEKRYAHFFAQHDARIKGASYDFYVKDVGRATSAAPTYFEVALIKALDNTAYPLIDGGVFANNPTLNAYAEIRNAKSNPIARDMFIVSLGTGDVEKPYAYKDAKDWGAVHWVRPLIDIMMSGAAATTHYILTRMFDAVERREQYIRIQPDNLGGASSEIDDASPGNIAALVKLGAQTANNCDQELERIADILVQEGPDPVEFV